MTAAEDLVARARAALSGNDPAEAIAAVLRETIASAPPTATLYAPMYFWIRYVQTSSAA